MDWKKTFDKCKNKRVKSIDADTLLLIKCFFSSNVSHSSLENKYQRINLNKVICTKSFDETILPEVYKKLRTKLEEKLHNAEDICLMSDIQTAKQNSDFIGLETAVMKENFTIEVFVADMMRMPGNTHNAENIKKAIEMMVKDVAFLKITKIFVFIIDW